MFKKSWAKELSEAIYIYMYTAGQASKRENDFLMLDFLPLTCALDVF